MNNNVLYLFHRIVYLEVHKKIATFKILQEKNRRTNLLPKSPNLVTVTGSGTYNNKTIPFANLSHAKFWTDLAQLSERVALRQHLAE